MARLDAGQEALDFVTCEPDLVETVARTRAAAEERRNTSR